MNNESFIQDVIVHEWAQFLLSPKEYKKFNMIRQYLDGVWMAVNYGIDNADQEVLDSILFLQQLAYHVHDCKDCA